MNSENNRFYAQISIIGKELFRSPFDEVTKKRQNLLLIFSILTALISLAVIEPVDSTVSGFKFTLANPDVTKYIFGSITIYFLTLYIISLYQDLSIYRYQRTHIGSKLSNMAKQISLRAQKQWEITIRRANEAMQLIDERNKIFQERDAIVKIYEEKIDEIFKELKDLDSKSEELVKPNISDTVEFQKYINARNAINNKRNILLEDLNQLKKERDEKEEPYQELIEHMDSYDNLQALTNQSLKESLDKTNENQAKLIKKTIRKYYILSRARNLIEISFPILLALVALWLSILSDLYEITSEYIKRII